MSLAPVAWVGLAGGAGAGVRFVVDGAVRARVSRRLPVGTVVINLTGSLLLGLLTGLVQYHHGASIWALVAGAGFCGGFTTFSTASFETVRLIQVGDLRAASANAGVTIAGVLAAAVAGLALAAL